MSSRRDATKRPPGGRPPKRLFSIDSLRKERSGSDSDASSIASRAPVKATRIPSDGISIRNLQTEGNIGEENREGDEVQQSVKWTDGEAVRSPDELTERARTEPKLRNKPVTQRPIPLKLAASSSRMSGDEAPLPSPGKMRWNTLRAHVLPTTSSSPLPIPITRPSTPGSASTSSPPPSRPATPKSHRFGQKKIFRQVVEQAREAAVDEHRKFSDEILKACWSARFGNASMRPKVEREGSQITLGSTLHLPFMASMSSLPMVASPSMSSIQNMRRQPSSQTVATESREPSIVQIQRALTFSLSVNRPQTLPHETHVLSALLVPFLGPFRGDRLDLEQQAAVETFEYVIRTWKAPSMEVDLERCAWCCNAASVPSGSRVRILGALSSILFSRDKTFSAETPTILRSLFQNLFSLLMCLSLYAVSSSEVESLRAYIGAVLDGQCGTPSSQSLEKHYGVRFSRSDSEADVRRLIAIESLIGCLEIGSENSRQWILDNVLEEFWPVIQSTATLTSLLSCIHSHKLKSFANSASALLFSSTKAESADKLADVTVVCRIFRTRMLKEMEVIRENDVTDTRRSMLRLCLDLTCIRGYVEREFLTTQILLWIQDSTSWKASVEETIRDLIANAEWPVLLRLLPPVANDYPEDLREIMVPLILPLLHDRLMANAPEYPCSPLTEFLDVISHAFPKIFFKPIFTCAASGKDITIANQICVLNCISRYLVDFWCRDADMMSVALMSDPVGSKAQADRDGSIWGRIRVGRSVLLTELIENLRLVRRSKDPAVTARAVKFVTALEIRLGALIQAKEQTARIPRSQRLLLCALFREFRLLTRSLKPATWLASVVSWLLDEPVLDISDQESEEEIDTTCDKLRALYAQAQEALRGGSKRRTTAFVSPVIDSDRSKLSDDNPAYELVAERIALLDTLHKPLGHVVYPLLVLISGLLNLHDYARLGPLLWTQCLSDPMSATNGSITFLIMQCAERSPNEFLRAIEHDLAHDDPQVRRTAVQRISAICGWRFQVVHQDVILDRTYRRPFSYARPQINFVPTDMGTSSFAFDQDVYEFKDSHGHVLPLELRRRLAEIGWDEEDRAMDSKTQWIKTPMSLLPSLQLDVLETPPDDSSSFPESPTPSPEASPTSSPSGDKLLRRDSTANGTSRGAKRRPVFVQNLVLLLPQLAAMVKDENFMVANMAKNLVLDLMRDDPSLLSRAVFHAISGDEESLIAACTTVMTFLHTQRGLPPVMAHHLLNHLAGFLKSSVRQPQSANPLQGYAYSVPAIARLVNQVSKMSVREIRRAKVDMFLLPSGSFWFPSSAPAGPMFPRGLDESQDPFETLPPSLVWTTLIRTSQNMLFLRMLERDPQELKIIRKNLSRLVLPSRSSNADQGFLPFALFTPRRHRYTRSPDDPCLTALSLTLARSYLLLVAQMFWSMSRHLNDRQELAILVDGLNRVLLTHGDDIGIVGHAMLAYMLASTRFKRMFISGGAYALFMPVIIKTYSEAEAHPGIRTAIEYAVNRFYALHQESFVFQSFDVVSHMFMSSDVDHSWLSRHVFTLFSTLKNGTAPMAPDVAGIYDLNKLQEQENRMVAVAEEVPQTFLASLRKTGSAKNQVTLVLPEGYESKRLGLDNLVRLFLTVIAHNPGIQRAERFLRLLRLLAPHLYNASSSARSVLREGIDALGTILVSRSTAKTKGPEGPQARSSDDFSYEVLVDGTSHEAQQGLSPADLLAMRLDYLMLVAAFTKSGGQLGSIASARVLELIRLILKESIISAERIATFLTEYLTAVLLREPAPTLKEVLVLLNEVAPIVSAYCTSVNFAGVFDVVTTLCANTVFASESQFAQLVVSRFCRIGLEACESAASEGWLLSLPSRMMVITLMNCAISLVGCDVLDEFKHAPSYHFLAGVVLPFVLTMKTSTDLTAGTQWTDSRRRDAHSRAWMRMLAYILSICQNTRASKEQTKSNPLLPERRKSQDSRSSSTSLRPAMTFAIAMQILKIIVIRAEEDLSSAMPSVWLHIGSVLRSLLSDGDAIFALRTYDLSEPPSPLQSPRVTGFAENPFLPSSMSSRSLHRLAPPRLIDYLTWSFIQWLCLRRSPLMLQMRGFIHEKVAALHQELTQAQSAQNPSAGLTPGPSPIPISARRLSNAFVRPRKSMLNDSAVSSAASTPRNSTFLSASLSLPTFNESSFHVSTPRKDKSDVHGGRMAGFAREASPSSPSGRGARDGGPRIVHLGPVTPRHSYGYGYGDISPSARRSPSPSGARGGRAGGALAAAKETVVTMPVLVETTYRRIRTAQSVLGYTVLLPMGEEGQSEEGTGGGEDVRAWTKREAVEAVLQEVKDLMEEFREEYTDVGEGSGVLVDVDEPASPLKT